MATADEMAIADMQTVQALEELLLDSFRESQALL
jgi:hypothetical protein